ncbi:MAG: ABC transporter ATP-binding protein [Actinobacteria bacterium]|nr:ABC transporter ATP-binding protein [Actinomycetota bacterium]
MLAVEDLHAYYEQSHVVQGVSLHVNTGEIVGLVGRNGAGKTTTLKAIMGVVRARPGRVRLAGVDITQMPTHEIARAGLTLVPEDRRIFPSLTVAENLRVASLAVRNGAGPRATLEQVFEYFPKLRERLDHTGEHLSGGEQQMLALARGLLAQPQLMLVDELTGGLMPILVESLMTILARIRERGMTVLLVEQDLGVVLDLADRCYVLDQGRIQFHGSADELRENRDIQQRYLGVS